MADLAAYRPVWRRPLLVPYGRHVIATNPPPSSGGVLIGHMLSVLEGVPGPRPPGRARTLRAYAETMRAAGRMRYRAVSPGSSTAAGSAATCWLPRRSRRAGRPWSRPSRVSRRRRSRLPSDAGTTHVSAVDRAGNACAFTASNGSPLRRDRPRHGAPPEQHDGRGGPGRRPPHAARDAAHQHAGAVDGDERGRAGAGHRLERLEPAAVGDHAGGDQRPRPPDACAARPSTTRASTSRATGSTARAGSTRPSWSCLSAGASA